MIWFWRTHAFGTARFKRWFAYTSSCHGLLTASLHNPFPG
jgi:hypothetical protein